MGFRDASEVTSRTRTGPLSVFPANRGVPRLSVPGRYINIIEAFSIPCESWGSATFLGLYLIKLCAPFSIPCESWGSATSCTHGITTKDQRLSVFPANRGVPRLKCFMSMIPGFSPFQYSLRIVGFRDDASTPNGSTLRSSFSIPCESWGSATPGISNVMFSFPPFQYSLRIVGFRDGYTFPDTFHVCHLSVFPANRGVPRQIRFFSALLAQSSLSVFPANRGVPRLVLPRRMGGGEEIFQYSLRIVGFRDLPRSMRSIMRSILSVFPANRGVPRLPPQSLPPPQPNAFSIPCESWGSATHSNQQLKRSHL